ncbi:MAG: APC family permease [Spirochaetaceae bacterium]|nr:APC family permease [Spirochaetaceae bacterium]
MTTDSKTESGLGLGACVMLLIGAMVGSAIFSLSGMTIYQAGPAALLSWVIAAVVMLCYGLTTAELSAFFPKSGGVFVFPARAFGADTTVRAAQGSGGFARTTRLSGTMLGWVSTWGYLNANIAAMAFSATYVAVYLGVGFPAFAPLQVPLALGAIFLCLVINSLRVMVLGRANVYLVIALMTTLLAFILAAFTSGQWDGTALTPFFTQGAEGGMGFLSSVPVAMVAYGSIVSIAFMVSEVKTPNKNVPRSMFIAFGVVVALYGLTILAVVGLVSARFLAENPGMRYIPLYAACFTKLAAVPWLAKVISVSAVLALLTTMLVIVALTSRAVQAVAEAGMLPRPFAYNLPNGTPVTATILVVGTSAVTACFPQFSAQMASSGALFSAVTISINCVSLLAARSRFVLPAASFRAPGGPVLPVITLGAIIACYVPGILSGGWKLWGYTAVWYAIGLVIFAAQRHRSRKKA